MRGEHNQGFQIHIADEGSSPHARGARGQKSMNGYSLRFIPACAGSTNHGQKPRSRRRVHPRMRGEHIDPRFSSALSAGSSPHARGAHFATSASGRHSRLIHSLFASSSHPSGLSNDYIFARRDTCWHCSNPWRAHRQVSRHQCRSVGE